MRKSAYQLAVERRAEQERRDLEREQAAAHFLSVLEAHKKQARRGPTWPGSSAHAGHLASVGGHEFHGHEAPASSQGNRRIQQPKRGKR